MTLLHIVVDVPGGGGADPLEAAEEYAAWGVKPVSAAWDMVQVPPGGNPGTPDGPMLTNTVLVLTEHHGQWGGYVLPGPGMFHLARHYRPGRPFADGVADFNTLDEYDHSTFAGRVDGTYGFAVGADRPEVVTRLLRMADEAGATGSG